MVDGVEQAHKAAERVARESYGRLLAFLVVRTRDVAGAEDALADAFAAALRTWPVRGVPDDPGTDRRRHRRGLSHPVRDHGPAVGKGEDTDPAGRHSVTRAGPRRSSRTP